jgi:heme exporter protein C
MFSALANPHRFMAFSRWAAPLLGALSLGLIAYGLWTGLSAPPDYQQGYTVKIMFIHVPAAWMAMMAYSCLAGASLISLVFRHALADAAAKAVAPLGAVFTAVALATGSLWGRPMWGAWWVWGDARLMSMLVLFLLFLGYMALRSSIDDEAKAARAAEILALVGIINLLVVKVSVDCFNTLHQAESVVRTSGQCPIPGLGSAADSLARASEAVSAPKGGSALAPVYLHPLLIMGAGYAAAFGALWLSRIRAEVWRRRAVSLALRAALS